jgi:thiaminase/transcriptional activator TenA
MWSNPAQRFSKGRDMPTFSQQAWDRNLPLYETTRDMAFNRELSQGTLGRDAFRHYMIQDAHYLEGFARALSLVSAKGLTADHVVQFAEAAGVAIVVERSLHAEFFKTFGVSEQQFQQTERAPVCDHYVSFLLSNAALQPFEVGLAGLLPCFWIYREVGHHIHKEAETDNPYRAWIDTYAGDEFSAAVDRVIAVVDGVAETASAKNVELMHAAYRRSAQLEWMFWDSAYRQASWPV